MKKITVRETVWDDRGEHDLGMGLERVLTRVKWRQKGHEDIRDVLIRDALRFINQYPEHIVEVTLEDDAIICDTEKYGVEFRLRWDGDGRHPHAAMWLVSKEVWRQRVSRSVDLGEILSKENRRVSNGIHNLGFTHYL